MNIKKDFNSMFWGIIGVNNRVFEVEDIFKKTRDKQADEKWTNINKTKEVRYMRYIDQKIIDIQIITEFMNYLKNRH